MMEYEKTSLPGLLLLRQRIFADERGHFLETFNRRDFERVVGDRVDFVQDNESASNKGVLRGLHFQVAPHAQGKLVRVIHGSVLDVCVDIRPKSNTYGEHYKVHLNGRSKEMLWIPPGFAHGFVAMEEDTIFAYKCTAYYHPASERTLLWNDHQLGIDWGVVDPTISTKDEVGMTFEALNSLHS